MVYTPARDHVLLVPRVVAPATPLGRPRVVTTIGSRFVNYHLREKPVMPAQVDPQDPAHLLLFDGRIHGWFQRDGNVVNIRPGDSRASNTLRLGGPATRPTTAPAG
jgi:hypothetical protein